MFLSLAGNSQEIYRDLASTARNHRLVVNGKTFVGWNKRLIERGHYFFAFSHTPFHELRLPDRTFTFTCLRNPVDRVLSHYKMLLAYKQSNTFRPDYEIEAQWLGESFGDFLDNIPKQSLFNQLYMFSEDLSVNEAFDNISHLSHFFFTESFQQGVQDLSAKTGLPLEAIHIRKAAVDIQPSEPDLARLNLIMQPEFELYERLQHIYKPISNSRLAKTDETKNA
jgi:hypothetical protein